ncbi:Dichloromethane dehalogenase [Chromobacterium violaceum]|uniref:Dichloromethane dehalogenase n=1 Tax=Chromobacterium violaceum TaxID=536 RepID=A0A447T8A9_CHRVL|nr:Dichloromethane dehalogenase [Chromobacterium violaceum]
MLDEPFQEQQIDLYLSDSKARILAAHPAGKVPVLVDDQLRIWDSLAICEYLAECFPAARLWPDDSALRAVARSIVAEIHSGFVALRENLPMDITLRQVDYESSPALESDIARVIALWKSTWNATSSTAISCSAASPSPTPASRHLHLLPDLQRQAAGALAGLCPPYPVPSRHAGMVRGGGGRAAAAS